MINNKKIKSAKVLALTQVFSLILEIFAFSFILGGMAAFSSPIISAEDSIFPSKCCLETKDGGICQDILESDSGLCKTNPLFTSCDNVETCKTGCCYNPAEGSCSLNSPKEKCEENGGTWDSNKNCEIPQCQIGCCVIADQASTTTIRECSLLSEKYGVKPNFQALDSDGTCDSKTGLSEKGACLSPAADYSGLNSCKFTTKEQCKSGDFRQGFLCTAKELNTECKPKKDTTCVDGKDEVYYVDTCGNPANIYDLTKFNNQEYWTKIIGKENSCSASGNANCGNCDYMDGSICRDYRQGKDPKPSAGNKVCRNLNCLNGRKNGESWCINDYSNTGDYAVAPIGTRSFLGKCINGEISIEQCADFNNEICISAKNDGFSEAKCAVNEWRSCLAANEKESYKEVEKECKKSEQCVMFLDISGNDKYLDLPGFKKDIFNSKQGSVGDIGKDANKIIAHCVPKYTPGMAFWSAESLSQPKISVSESGIVDMGKQASPGNQYGGDYEETKAICSMASFTCVTEYEREVSALDKGSWEIKANAECMIDGKDFSEEKNGNLPVYSEEEAKVLNDKQRNKEQLFIEGLQERCRSLGPCGVYVNIAGELGNNKGDESFKRTEMDIDGTLGDKYIVEENKLSSGYINSLKGKANIAKSGSMNRITGAVVSWITGMGVLEQLAGLEKSFATPLSQPLPAAGPSVLGNLGGAIFEVFGAAVAAYGVGQIIGQILGLSSEQNKILSLTLLGAGGAGGAAYVLSSSSWGWTTGVGFFAFIILSIFISGKESKYYITEYTCEPWEPPKTGNCDSCNKDIRACSEYRCRSLGQNCQYFIENGEPGYCASSKEQWSAKITPWQQALTEGNKYASATSTGFIIQSKEGGKVASWVPLQFGIQTDKPAMCKLDIKHTKSYDEMKYDMQIETIGNIEDSTSSNQGYYHKITLSPHVIKNSSASETPGISAGEENNYYIRCRNFAGQENEAEFAVRIIADEGQDLTPPLIKKFIPETGSYVRLGENSSRITFLVDEPSECKYSFGNNLRYEEMNFNATCNSNPDSAVFGLWPCYANLNNLKAGENKFYFACKDQPKVEERLSSTRNINRNSKEYSIKVCEKGLEITKLEPQEAVVTGKSSAQVEISAETSGCIENGKSICSYKFEGESSADIYIPFLETDSNKHKQIFTEMPAGKNNISIRCEDEAGNKAYGSITAEVFLDNIEPAVTRAYIINGALKITTNENAVCKYTNEKSLGCEFNFEGSENQSLVRTLEGSEKIHNALWLADLTQNYYIKCADAFGNMNAGCAIAIKA